VKPAEARRCRQAAERQRAAHGERLEHFLRTGQPRDQVNPDLIPTDADHREIVRRVRSLCRQAERTPRGPRRAGLLDELLLAMARQVFVERVVGLEPVDRAVLTPARLVALSVIEPGDLEALWRRMKGEGGVLLPGQETGE
jgi:hypothetical protein